MYLILLLHGGGVGSVANKGVFRRVYGYGASNGVLDLDILCSWQNRNYRRRSKSNCFWRNGHMEGRGDDPYKRGDLPGIY